MFVWPAEIECRHILRLIQVSVCKLQLAACDGAVTGVLLRDTVEVTYRDAYTGALRDGTCSSSSKAVLSGCPLIFYQKATNMDIAKSEYAIF